MIRTNLATRPFYNERLVRVVLGALMVVVLGATALNVVAGVRLSREHGALDERVSADEAIARERQREATRVRGSVAQTELERVAAAAREANRLIDRRTFSWTALLNHIEATLPADVMLLSISPAVADGGVTLTMVVRGRSVEDIDDFMERLEDTGAFTNLLSRDESAEEEGTFRVALIGRYRAGDDTPVEPAPTAGAAQAEAGRAS